MKPLRNDKKPQENSGLIQFDVIEDNEEIEKNIIDFIYEEQKREAKEKLEMTSVEE